MPIRTPTTKSDQDNAYNPEELHAAERFPEAYAHHGTGNRPHTPSGASEGGASEKGSSDKEAPLDTSAGINAIREKEQAGGGGWKNNFTGAGASRGALNKGSFRANFTKKGPIGLIISLMTIGGVSMVSVPSLLPIHASKALENFYGNVSRAASPHYKAIQKFSIGNNDACQDASSARCKMATVNDDTLDRYAKQGFKVDSDKVGDRHLIKSATFPDGTTVNNGEDFVAHTERSISARSSAFGIFNPRSGPYVGTSFTELLNKFGLSKARITLSGDDREEQARSFNREVGAPQDGDEEDPDTRRTQAETEIKTKAAKSADKVKNVLGLACAAYDTARISLATVKFMNAVEYMAFGYFVLKLGDQIRTGDIDGTTLAIAAGMLTRVASSGDYKGKSAMDSPGMKSVLHGDRNNLQGAAQNILLGGNPALKKLDDTLKFVKEQLGTTSTHAACKASEDFLVGGALTAAVCATSGGGAGSIIPGLGTLAGGIVGTGICTVGNLAVAIAGSIIMGAVLERVMPAVLDYFKNKPLTYDSPVEDIGNGITIGAGLLFASTGTGKGMKLGTKDEVDTFQAKVAYEADKEYAEVARYQAKDTPFDVTNEYSFMGQLLGQMPTATGSNVVASALTTVGSILSNAQVSLISSAANAADMPSPMKSYTMGECQDAELAEQNIACNNVGQALAVQSSAEMNRDEGENLNYMVSNGYIENDGTVNPDKDYAKFLQYCTKQEGTIPGSSNLSIADDDYDWPTEKCNSNSEMISNFRTRAFRFDLKKDEDTAYKDQGGGAAPQETAPEGSDIVGDDYKNECSDYTTCTRQCVDFVLFRLMKHGVLKNRVALGNGKDVVGTLGRMGYKVDTTPAVHAVMSTPVTSQPEYGHTAMVSQVNADGSFVVEEYNFARPGLTYGTRTIPASDIAAKKMTFAHTEVDYK